MRSMAFVLLSIFGRAGAKRRTRPNKNNAPTDPTRALNERGGVTRKLETPPQIMGVFATCLKEKNPSQSALRMTPAIANIHPPVKRSCNNVVFL